MAALEVRIVSSEDELAALATTWERLQSEAAVTSVFETFDWQACWWRTYGQRGGLRVVVASDEHGVVGILPLHVKRVATMRFPVRTLRFIGDGGDTYPDDLGAILARGREEEGARALARAVASMRGWDVLLASDMQTDSPLPAALAEALSGARIAARSGRSERIALLELPPSWDAFLASLHRDKRYRIRNIRKKLASAYPDARFFAWTDRATLDAGIARLGELHRKRWRRLDVPHGFESPEYLQFHRDVMHACFAKDRLRLYALEAGGSIIAMYYFYKFRDRVFLMQSGFDPDLSAHKPGQVLLGYIVEHAIGEGARVLDFLRGDHRYKEELATGERETVFVHGFKRRPGAWIHELRRRQLPALKALAKDALARVRPPPSPEGG